MEYTLAEKARIIELTLEELAQEKPDMKKVKESLEAVKESLISRSRKKQMELGL